MLIQDQVVGRKGYSLAPDRRHIGMVFQDLALFPHLTVAGNVAFGLRGWAHAQTRERVEGLLHLVGLDDYREAYPHELSGGQQQRVALIRAVAPRPRLLLLDEPFSSQDVELREQLAREVRRILRHEHINGLLVTHDQHEAFAFADLIGVIDAGRLHQWAKGYDLYHFPADRFVADFIGQGEFLTGRVLADGRVETPLGVISGRLPLGCGAGDPVDLLVRPDDVLHDDHSSETARIVDRAFRGADFLYTLALDDGTRLLCQTPSHHDHEIGSRIGIRLQIDHLVLLPHKM